MRYLWSEPIRLDKGKRMAFLGEEPHTRLPDAAPTTLKALKVS